MQNKYVLVTGGAGFIGCNVVDAIASEGKHVLVLDSLVRPGVVQNLNWLKLRHPALVSSLIVDLRDPEGQSLISDAVKGASAVFHFAAQVAVTSSLERPLDDFQINAYGTLKILEMLRRHNPEAPLLFASTNKVYGKMADVEYKKIEGANAQAYRPMDKNYAEHGFDESRQLDFYSPYGCSKGVADQYVLDYARVYGLRTAVMRKSCIYGPRQFGTEDQGWVAHFAIQALQGKPITLYGDGHQVRDLLFVADVVRAYLAAWRNIDEVKGQAFNLGGGPENAVSLLELLNYLEVMLDRKIDISFGEWRQGDQVYYVSDTRKAQRLLGLQHVMPWRTGVSVLVHWLKEQHKVRVPA